MTLTAEPPLVLTQRDVEIARLVLARKRLADFCARMDPSYESAAHTKILCEHLEAVEAGEIDRLAVFLPPRHSKSLHVSQRFPAWYLGRNPSHQFILSSYGAELAEANSRVVRNLMQDARYPFSVRVASDSSAVNRWGTDRGGVVIAAGVGSALTGFGGNVLVVDDPVKGREEADSETFRERAWEWYTEVARTRLMPGGRIVLCQTRWHEDDLAGRILNGSGSAGWTVVDMPALDDAGQALWPEWFDEDALNALKSELGSRAWSALYQQRPQADKGGMFKREWMKLRWTTLPQTSFRVLALDSAYKTGMLNDFSVIAAWGISADKYPLLDIVRGRWEYPELKAKLIAAFNKWHPNAVLIEDTSAGQSIIQELRSTRMPIIPIKVPAGIEAYAASVTPLFEAMRVSLPQEHPELDNWINEHVSFNAGKHDDTVATTHLALRYMSKIGSLAGSFGPMDLNIHMGLGRGRR